MKSYICLFLDKQCQVVLAVIKRGALSDVTAEVRRMSKEKTAWGYEIWADNRCVVSSYDCDHRPSRVQLRRT